MNTILNKLILKLSYLYVYTLTLLFLLFLQHTAFAQKTAASDILAPNATVKQIFNGETYCTVVRKCSKSGANENLISFNGLSDIFMQPQKLSLVRYKKSYKLKKN